MTVKYLKVVAGRARIALDRSCKIPIFVCSAEKNLLLCEQVDGCFSYQHEKSWKN